MKILSSNQKTKVSLNFPVDKTCNRECPFFAKICYGQKGRFIFKNVAGANNKRFEFWKALTAISSPYTFIGEKHANIS